MENLPSLTLSEKAKLAKQLITYLVQNFQPRNPEEWGETDWIDDLIRSAGWLHRIEYEALPTHNGN